jgi:hypothetical protein
VHHWRAEHGGWAALAEELVRRAGDVGLPKDLGSIQRGLRRLSERGQLEGGQYGRWMLRYFGVPPRTEEWLRWLGQYHSRFTDLPVPLCEQQLALWDRPPVADSAAGVWIDLGVVSVSMRKGDRTTVRARLARAAAKVPRAGVAALLEHRMVAARVASDEGDADAVQRWLDSALEHLDAPELTRGDALAYRARWLDAVAYTLLHPREGAPRIEEGLARYEAIPAGTGIPFVELRRALGRAYCMHRLGRRDRATELALEAADHAADGGFVRLRAMALDLAGRTALEPQSSMLRERARRLAIALEDEDLRARVERPPRMRAE